MHPVCHLQLRGALKEQLLIVGVGTANNIELNQQVIREQPQCLNQQVRAFKWLGPARKNDTGASIRPLILGVYARNGAENTRINPRGNHPQP